MKSFARQRVKYHIKYLKLKERSHRKVKLKIKILHRAPVVFSTASGALGVVPFSDIVVLLV